LPDAAMSDLASFSSREDLVSAVKGKSDRDLLADAAKAGAEGILMKLFMGMMMSFDAGRAGGRKATIEYDIGGPGAARHRYQVHVADGQCTISQEATSVADVTLRMSLPTFLRVSTSTANPLLLLLLGKLKVRGDRRLAREIKGWFSKRI
jgi:putative sterol carrier protein